MKKAFVLLLILFISPVLYTATNTSSHPTHTQLYKVKTPIQPKQVLFSVDKKYIFVTCLVGNGVEVYSAKDLKHVKTIKTGRRRKGTVELTYNPAKTEIWASQMTTNNVYVIDVKTLTVKKRIPTRGVWSKVIAFRPDGKFAYVSNWITNNVSVIDTQKYKVIKKIKTGKTPRGIAFTPDGKYAYVCGFYSRNIMKIDARRHVMIKYFRPIGGNMRHIVITKDGKRAFISNMGRNCVFVFDLTRDKIVKKIMVGRYPNTIELTPNERYLYVSCRKSHQICVIDTKTYKVVTRFSARHKPTALDISPDGNYLCYSDFHRHHIILMKINWPQNQTTSE